MNGHATMNRCFRVVWNAATAAWQAVAETAPSGGKTKSSSRLQRRSAALIGAVALAAAVPTSWAQSLPTGGNIVAGSGSIATSGTTMTVTQNTAKLAADWQSFNIGKGNTVNFVQPSASAVALNRVLGSDVSVIQGAINANGQVFLLNPNGVLFTSNSQVNVGAIVASTLNLSTADFLAGNYNFVGGSSNAVINQGNISAVGEAGKGGTIALIAAKITNDGNLTATGGNVLLGAGSDVTLDLGGPVKLQVKQGAIDALVQNGGAIQADGGLVYLTAQAVNELSSATINNTGVIRAQTLATGEKGEIRLMADMKAGTVNVGGTLDARAPNGGDGGFIETSGAMFSVTDTAVITSRAVNGATGTWLIDPDVLEIVAAGSIPGAGAGTSQISTATLNTALTSNNVDLQANQYIDLQSQLTYTGARAATLGLYAPVVGLGADIDSTTAALGLTFGGTYNSTSYTGNVYLYGGARTLATHGGDVVFNGNLGGNQDLTINTRGASTSGTITHNALVDGAFSTLAIDVAAPIHNYVALADTSGGVVTLKEALNVSGSIDISSKQFVNNAGASALQTGAGKIWRVWSTNATPYDNTVGDTIGALAYSFKQYGASYGASTPAEAGNAYLLSVSPTVTLQITTAQAKTYDGNTNATLASGAFSVQGGAVGGDIVSLVNGSLPTTGSYNSKDVSTATTVSATVGASAISATEVSGVKVYGYQVDSTANGAGQIDPATASLSAVKVFDGNANLGSAQITVSGVNGETLSLSGSGTAAASSAVVADNSTNYLTSLGVLTLADGTLGTPGLDGNYVLPSLLSRSAYNTAAINPLGLTVLGVGGSRTYNGNTTFYAGLELRLGSGVVVGDIVTLNGYANVVSKDVGTYTQWASSNLYLADRNAANYTLSGGLISAVIMPAPLGISLTGIYSGGTSLIPTAFSTYGLVSGETITGLNAVLNDANVSANGSNYVKSAVVTGGTANLTNYKITQTYNNDLNGSGNAKSKTTNVATITPKAITATGVSAADKVYDATTAATLNLSAAVLSTVAVGAGNSTDKKAYSTDEVTLVTTTATGAFADKNVGRDKAVTVTGFTLSGAGAGNYSISDASSAMADITAKAITASGVTATTKVYDATTTATLNLSAVALKATETAGSGNASDNTAYTGDAVTLVTTAATGTFADKNAGTGKAFTITGYTLTGADAGNYTISDASAASGNITAKAITASGLSSANKVYDATTVAAVNGTAALQATSAAGAGTSSDGKAYTGDTVSLTGTAVATYFDKDVLDANKVSFTSLSLAGAEAGNYSLTQHADDTAARITAKAITASGIAAQNKVYDATEVATLVTGNGVLDTETAGTGTSTDNKAYTGDTVSLAYNMAVGAFSNKNVGTGKSVAVSGLSLSGTDAGNYTISDASNVTANITPKAITITAQTNSKTYDGNTTAVASPTVSGLVQGSSDTVTGLAETYDNKNAGTGKTMTVSAYTVNDGNSGDNYTVTTVANNTGVINKAVLGVDVNGRYNGTTGFTTSNATIATNGLLGGDTLTGVTVRDANVSSNGSNYITAFTGGTASLGNYQLSASTDTTSSGESISTTHNNASIDRAPLGVTVAGTYNGTDVMSTAAGATITAYGLVGQDANANLSTATLDLKDATNARKVLALTGSGLFDQRNYVLNGSINATGGTGTAGTAPDGSGATNTANIARMAMTVVADDKVKVIGGVDPALTYHFTRGSLVNNDSLVIDLHRETGEALGRYAINAMASANQNYEVTLVDGILTIAPVPIPPSSPIIVPAFVDNGAQVLAGQSSTNFGGLTYVLTDGSTDGPANADEDGKRKSSGELNINNVTVPSSTGPLDVFVVDTGINLESVAELRGLTN